jgi:hypothetical protein
MDPENNRKTIDLKIRPGLRPDVLICAVIVVATLGKKASVSLNMR